MKRDGFSQIPVLQATKEAVLQAERELAPVFLRFEEIEAKNQWKVLNALQEENIAQRHFAGTTGYGYDDVGRDAFDRAFARAMDAKSALVRPQIVNGTHALYLALSGLLRPNETLLCITGKPYDTLDEAITAPANSSFGALSEFKIEYKQLELKNDKIDTEAVCEALKDSSVKVVYAQRSRGYAWREAISLAEFESVFAKVHDLRPDVFIVVDNCYGEFTQTMEPTAIGADIIAGSLIKNPGGGLAPTGGYIAGNEAAVERIAHRLTVPGMGGEVGSYAAGYLPFFQGLFLAPHVTCQSLKTAALFARVLENRGMLTLPRSDAERFDIIQALRLNDAQSLISFVKSIQKAAPVDSFVVPEPWDMPGYSHPVIMAAGTFIQGASIELSADAPIREPYTAYIQGALTYSHGRIAVMLTLDSLMRGIS
ncbi:methionine gamma-lyase family protein [Eubacteriales bacterium OttesenSCG-928-K08]|nr:methionine gamma-lyase family protein [Eubacteriales bacterium OttesenSCG-928-K08]